jgi:hypothetical protein
MPIKLNQYKYNQYLIQNNVILVTLLNILYIKHILYVKSMIMRLLLITSECINSK